MYKDAKILVVDDNEEILIAIEMLLSNHFGKIHTTRNPNTIPSILSKELFDVIILDMNYNAGVSTGNEGIYWMNEILKVDSEAIVVFITAYGDFELAVKAIREGGTDFIQKPWDDEKFITTIENAYKLRKSKCEIINLRQKQQHLNENISQQFPDIIGESNEIRDVFKTINKVAKTDANILILGENGTGKELIAREIHRKSNRSNEVFVNLDVSALPDSLFESELFGYVKGAFTDAKIDKPGRIELASKGTLFLDEIGNLSFTAQSKLLTVLQNREISRLGANYKIPIDIRLICATNKSIHQMVSEEKFREDLLYRINTIQIDVPPLRSRLDDIPLLISYFKKKYEDKYQKNSCVIDKAVFKKLSNYNWPGNIRELQHIIEKAVILCDNESLQEKDFWFGISDTNKLKDTLDLSENEKRIIIRAIEQNKGNYSIAAKDLGISRKTLYNKLKKYDLE
ncbi:MAG: sigma-54-dependent Fis family transcriptional regulator [Bacteroidales bacterium]|nr:sigma-54-dependent Fis family transcriptional regulator [Bacteroidales bacterium]